MFKLEYIILIIVIVLIFFTNTKEGFYLPYYSRFTFPNKYCQSCNKLTPLQCSGCVNCGTCITHEGLIECVPGDRLGPFFKEDCLSYTYNVNLPFRSPYSSFNYNDLYFPRYSNYSYRKNRFNKKRFNKRKFRKN
jgi:hypothetical protein